MTNIQAFNAIYKKAHLTDEHIILTNGTEAAFQQLHEAYGLTDIQLLLLSQLLNGNGFAMSLPQLAEELSMSLLSMLCYEEDLNVLCQRHIISHRVVSEEFAQTDKYCVYSDFVQALRKNVSYVAIPHSEYQLERLLQEIRSIALNTDLSSGCTATPLCNELRNLIADTRHLQFSRVIYDNRLNDNELRILLAGLDAVYHNDYNQFDYSDCSSFFINRSDWNYAIRRSKKCHQLCQQNKWLEFHTTGGAVSVDSFSLTRTFFEQVLPEYEYLCNQRFASCDEKKLESNMGIAPKQLYYNPREESELKQLEQLLQPNVFQQVQQRLAESGFRSGFACLFYGVAGCGKTETVLQLARSTNRSILRINPNDIQDKFVGESEKNLKNAFDRYRRMVNDAHANDEPCPILLFNEADAVFSRRLNKISSSVDQMQNSLQNILLQEMETLPGILIATTNLSENFDSAFERRFIYKILFEKPSPEVASHIWQTMLPNLTANEALQLAEEYHFTGGQIENIARKQQVEYILTGKQSSMADLQGYCKQEFLHNAHTSRKMIGFAAGN